MNSPSGSATLPTSSLSTFADLDLPAPIVAALAQQGITEPSPVQRAVVPDALGGLDVLGRARTGSGKTLSFGLPVLARLAGGTSRPKAPRALILLPTRELAGQVLTALEPLAATVGLRLTTVYGGVPINKQINALKRGVDVVIATPGRLTDLIDRRVLSLDHVEITVLDEADHLCDLGFYKPVDALLAKTPQDAQRLLLSATLDGEVDKLVRRHLPHHARHDVDDVEGQPATMEHHVMVSAATEKSRTVLDLVKANPRTIVFTRTKRGAMRLARQLSRDGVTAVDLHGDLSQRHRERNLARFSSGQADVVVATDVAARGIHVDGIGLVVHYDAPAEHKAYLHRSGRTARAGESGSVVTMTTPEALRDVVALQRKAGVTARHHEASTTPQPMTVESLSTSGTEAPAAPARGNGGSTSSTRGNGNGSSNGSGGGRNRNRNRNRRGGQGGQRPTGQRSSGQRGGGQRQGGGGDRRRSSAGR